MVPLYKDMGIDFTPDLLWDSYHSRRLREAGAKAAAHRGVLAEHRLPWRVRELCRTQVVEQTLTSGAPVWAPLPTADQRRSLDAAQLEPVETALELPRGVPRSCLRLECLLGGRAASRALAAPQRRAPAARISCLRLTKLNSTS